MAMWAVVVLLTCVYFFPLWVISLEAPQYPEGIGMHIWIHKITGRGPHDLQNINGLNHYIGMKEIHADAIPELKFMKYFLAFLIAAAAVTAIARRRILLIAWVVIAIVLSGVGMFDFYQWEYNYGHDLDPSAAIKVPGMNYQPPMFGTKKLLNFYATAWPGPGGLAAMLSVGLGALALAFELFRSRSRKLRESNSGNTPIKAAAVVLLVPLLLSSCSGAPQPIEYGADQCTYCMMAITDDRYGTEVLTKKGRTYKFDSIECMVNTVIDGTKITASDVGSWYATDYANRRTLIDAETAVFLYSQKLPSPMGENLTAFSSSDDADYMLTRRGGTILDWDGIWQHLEGGGREDLSRPGDQQ